MELIPHNWNVIVVGLWNKAILVPNFVSENIFGNLTGATFNVQIPVNLIGPPRIKNGDFVFIPDNQQIIIEIENCTIENLLKAMDYAKKSIEVLPLTPFFASGFNINYEIRDINTTVLSNIMNSKIDNILSHQDYNIIDKKIVRTLSFNGGQINIIMDFINAVKFEIQVNFHRDSILKDELISWISIQAVVLNSELSKILRLFEEGQYA